MNNWKRFKRLWINWPNSPRGIIEFIGGSYLAASPHITYRRLLEGLIQENFAVHAWSYIPGLDHQFHANQAWKDFRLCKTFINSRKGELGLSIRIGHSLGSKLHLLAPDGGRNSKGLAALSFNNFAAQESIPMLNMVGEKLKFKTEFSPSPKETMSLVLEHYSQAKNLLIKFTDDNIDQSHLLLNCLQKRPEDKSLLYELRGNHLTPASAGLRQKFIGEWANDKDKSMALNTLISTLLSWTTN